MTEHFWLLNPNRSMVKRFTKNKHNKDKFFDYMFIDSGKIVGVFGKYPPVMKTTVSVEIDLAREIYERLLSQGWRKTEEVWLKKENM